MVAVRTTGERRETIRVTRRGDVRVIAGSSGWVRRFADGNVYVGLAMTGPSFQPGLPMFGSPSFMVSMPRYVPGLDRVEGDFGADDPAPPWLPAGWGEGLVGCLGCVSLARVATLADGRTFAEVPQYRPGTGEYYGMREVVQLHPVLDRTFEDLTLVGAVGNYLIANRDPSYSSLRRTVLIDMDAPVPGQPGTFAERVLVPAGSDLGIRFGRPIPGTTRAWFSGTRGGVYGWGSFDAATGEFGTFVPDTAH